MVLQTQMTTSDLLHKAKNSTLHTAVRPDIVMGQRGWDVCLGYGG